MFSAQTATPEQEDDMLMFCCISTQAYFNYMTTPYQELIICRGEYLTLYSPVII